MGYPQRVGTAALPSQVSCANKALEKLALGNFIFLRKRRSTLASGVGRLRWNMSISEEQVKNALKSVKYPGFSRDIVSFGLVKSIQIDNGDVKVQLALAPNDPNVPATIKNEADRALGPIEG